VAASLVAPLSPGGRNEICIPTVVMAVAYCLENVYNCTYFASEVWFCLSEIELIGNDLYGK
jgi:hypothetical protein